MNSSLVYSNFLNGVFQIYFIGFDKANFESILNFEVIHNTDYCNHLVFSSHALTEQKTTSTKNLEAFTLERLLSTYLTGYNNIEQAKDNK